MYSKILIRFGELSTKGKNKMTFVRQLEKNIKILIGVKSEVEYDRIFLDYTPETLEGLKRIFGIHSYSPVAFSESNDDAIEKKLIELIQNIPEDKTFKVAVKRHWKGYDGSSMELNQKFGGVVLKNRQLKVDVRKPDYTIQIEIRQNRTYISFEKILGLGGLPVGVNGKVLHLLSGGIDSPIAALEMMKRGIKVDVLNFITPPHTDEKTIDKVNRIIEILTSYQGDTRLYRSEYTTLMNLIGLVSKQSYKITLMRRSFYRIANTIALRHAYLGISNGDNLGQVASQTLESINVIQEVCTFPVFRPLLTNDKLETIEKSINFGIYDISIEKANESCEIFAPKKPVIKPELEVALALEKELEKMLELEDINIQKEIEVKKFYFVKK